MTNQSTTEKHAARYHKDEPPRCASSAAVASPAAMTRRAGSCENGPDCTAVVPTAAPPPLSGRLEREALIARKRLAAAGRREEPGTTFGSRWTDAERQALATLYAEHGRRDAAAKLVEAHPPGRSRPFATRSFRTPGQPSGTPHGGGGVRTVQALLAAPTALHIVCSYMLPR